MGVGPLTVDILCTFFLAALLLYHYGNWRRHRPVITLAVLVAWYFSLIIIFVLPLDVSSTAYRQCLRNLNASLSENQQDGVDFPMYRQAPDNRSGNGSVDPSVECPIPWSLTPSHVLPEMWRVVYWTSQFLTWIVLPVMQSYSQAGDFTVVGKMRAALIDNAIYYGSYLLIFGALLVYLATKPDVELNGQKLKVLCVTASNTWGLTLLVLLLGYGLVEVPRAIWNAAKRGYALNHAYFKLAKLHVERSEAEEAVDDVLEDIQRASDSIRQFHPLRKHVDTILSKVPEQVRNYISNRQRTDEAHPTETPTEKSLVRLHRQLIRALQTQHRTQTQWAMLVERAFELEDVSRNEISHDTTYRPTFPLIRPLWLRSFYTPTVEWYWRCLVRQWVLRGLAVMLAALTVLVVWSEVTFFNKSPKLSLFAIFVDLAKGNNDYFYIELVSTLTIAYLCTAAYYSVFKIRILNYYYLARYHQTDEYSLIFCGMLLCRLTPPLCLNFLGLIHLDSHIIHGENIEETAYTYIMGHMDVISIISDGFNIYFPIAILVLCLATYFNVGQRFLHALGFQQFIGDDDMTGDLMEEGKELMKREKRKRQRTEEGEMRKRIYAEKFGPGSAYRSPRTMGRHADTKRDDDDRGGSIIHREDSGDGSRAELLRDVEPIDYTSEPAGYGSVMSRNSRPASSNNSSVGSYFSALGSQNLTADMMNIPNERYTGRNYSSSPRLYQSDGPSTRRNTSPPRRLFDDV